MNQTIDYYKLIESSISKGVNDIAIIGQLIGTGINPIEASKLLSTFKKNLNASNPIDSLPVSWLGWVRENLNRNCEAADLAQILNKELNIPVQDAYKIINKMIIDDSDTNDIKINEGFEYESPICQIKENTTNIDGHVVNLVMRYNEPTVIVFDNVLTSDECDEIIHLSKNKIKKSTVVDANTGAETYNQHRKSSGSFFGISENNLIQKIENRVAVLMNQPVENGEGFQILNYQVGGEYRPHFDFFDPALKGSKKHLANGGQRVATMVIYLNDVESGGETTFPEIGLTVSPKKGSAVYFEYCNSKGQIDKNSLHAGCPVIAGEKWILTKWVRENKFG